MGRTRQLVFAIVALLLIGTTACRKKPVATTANLPGPSQAPTLTQTLPYEIQPEKVPAPPTTAQNGEPQPKQQQKKRRSATRKNTPPPSATAANSAPNSNPPENTTADLRPPTPPVEPVTTVAIGPDVSSPEANKDRQSTSQLLDTTENQVKKLEQQNLSSDQHSVLMQVKAYISQSRKAITDGDYERASNLAKKAQLLTEELIKR